MNNFKDMKYIREQILQIATMANHQKPKANSLVGLIIAN